MNSTFAGPPGLQALDGLDTAQRALVTEAVDFITQRGAMPRNRIPRHRAAAHLSMFPKFWGLSKDLRRRVLSHFREGPPEARFGDPFQPLPTAPCRACPYEIVKRPSGWAHDVEPDDLHPAIPASGSS